jgi:hypothetical protein
MKISSRVLHAVVVMTSLFWMSVTNAVIISGSFAGTAVRVHGSPFDVQEGDPITGFFSLDTSYRFEPSSGDGVTTAGFVYNGRPTSPDPLPPPPLRIAFVTPVGTYDLAADIAELGLAQDAAGQTLDLLTNYGGPCCGALLTLSGGPGAFFSSLDVAALHGGPIDLSSSFGSYVDKGTFNFDVAFSSFSFDTLDVPEPQSLALVVVSLIALTGIRRRRPWFMDRRV